MTRRLKDYGEFGIPPSHPEYLPPAPDGEPDCESVEPHHLPFFWCCTRAAHHKGRHAAHIGNNHMVASWERKGDNEDETSGSSGQVN